MSLAQPCPDLTQIVIRGIDRERTNFGKLKYLMELLFETQDPDEIISEACTGEYLRGDVHILSLAGHHGEIRDYDRKRQPWYNSSTGTLDPSNLNPGETYAYKDFARGQEPWTMVVIANEFKEGDKGRKYFFAAVKEDLLLQN